MTLSDVLEMITLQTSLAFFTLGVDCHRKLSDNKKEETENYQNIQMRNNKMGDLIQET